MTDELTLPEEYQGATLPDGRQRYRMLESGAVYDFAVNHIIAKITTSEQGREMALRKIELKREAVRRGAMAAVAKLKDDDGEPLFENVRDGDWQEAIAEVQTSKALDPTDNRSTEAARWVFQEAGESEERAARLVREEENTDMLAKLGREYVNAFLERRAQLRREAEELIDAEVEGDEV